MTPQSLLLLYTDGLIEYDRALEEGEERLLRVGRRIVEKPGGQPALRVVADIFRVRDNLDDVALLTMRNPAVWSNTLSLTMSATPLAVSLLRLALRKFGEELGLSEVDLVALELCAGEAGGNVALHAYGPKIGLFAVEASVEGNEVSLSVEDWGRWGRSPVRVHSGRGLKVLRGLMDRVDIEEIRTPPHQE